MVKRSSQLAGGGHIVAAPAQLFLNVFAHCPQKFYEILSSVNFDRNDKNRNADARTLDGVENIAR